jgi:hypothetical protein
VTSRATGRQGSWALQRPEERVKLLRLEAEKDMIGTDSISHVIGRDVYDPNGARIGSA